jgi:hypothetical protein
MNTKKYKIWTVYCKCGERLVKYRKKGPGRLRKIHRDRIAKDFTGLFFDETSPIGTDVFCPACKHRIATIQKVNGKYVNKVNQGQLGIIKK